MFHLWVLQGRFFSSSSLKRLCTTIVRWLHYNIALCSEMPVADENGWAEDEEEEDFESDASLRARD